MICLATDGDYGYGYRSTPAHMEIEATHLESWRVGQEIEDLDVYSMY
jgi:hypothetical protein